MDFTSIDKRGLKQVTEIDKIARFFGFQPIEAPVVKSHDFELTRQFGSTPNSIEDSALLRMYFDEKMMSGVQPCMLFCERPFKGSKERKKPMRLEASLISIGSLKSVCECVSIQAALSIFKDLGFKNLEVKVNSIGDKESLAEFSRQMNSFVKKNYNNFDTDLRQATKKDPLAILLNQKPEWERWLKECPKPLDFLSESSRLHFKEVLEFLEVLEIPYSIQNTLIDDLSYGAETVYSISTGDEELAFGERFNRLAKKIGFKKDVGGTVLRLSVKLKKALKKVQARPAKPDAYLIQFGPEAKLKSFLILEQLYKNNIQVLHSIAKDKLSSQIGVAENSGIPYILLIGQKEAIENSVVVRNAVNRAQESVLISQIGEHMKKLLK